MNSTASLEQFAPLTFRFYQAALQHLQRSGIPFLLGGAYAFGHYTGIIRHTKDLDVFIQAADVPQVLSLFNAAGYRSEIFFSHWLAKVFHGEDFVDLIFSSGNGVCPVDPGWFEQAIEGEVLGIQVKLMTAEDMIWQKAYIMERERFDGADVIHLLRARGRTLAWDRLLARFGTHWRVLLSHLILFGFVYPADRETIPGWLLGALTARLREEPAASAAGSVCQGTLLSRSQYLADTEQWGYVDARLAPLGKLTEEQIRKWTDAGR